MNLVTKQLYFLLFLCFSFHSYAQFRPQKSPGPLFEEIQLKTHLRLKFNLPKDQLLIRKTGNKLSIQTLNIDLFNKLVGSLEKIPLKRKYFTSRFYDTKNYPNVPASIVLNLSSSNIEAFSFFRNESKDHIVDLWDNKTELKTSQSKSSLDNQVAVKTNKAKVIPKLKKLSIKPKVLKAKIKDKKVVTKKKQTDVPKIITKPKLNKDLKRDFRYGASFIWNYKPIFNEVNDDFSVPIKSIDYLYPVKDIDFKKDGKLAHLQLSINFYKRKKYGLMNKSITLYQNKYPGDKYEYLNEYLKANALIYGVQKNFDRRIFESALNKLDTIFQMTDDYELQKSILRYRIQDLKNQKKYVKLLDYGKRYVVIAQENFDDEGLKHGMKIILYSLAKLSLDKELEESIQNKNFKRLIPAQLVDSYLSYLYLKQGKYQKLIKFFEANKSSYGKNIDSSILYNTGEAYFREAQFEKSIALFDQFIKNYSLLTESSNARLRIALAYDFLDRDLNKVSKLYEEAINRSSNPKIRYEARLRYVGFELTRSLNLSEKQRELIVFLDQSEDEKRVVDKNLQHLLWLIRTRTFLVTENYQNGFDYIETIPLENLSQAKQRTFYGDGAEMLLGLVKSHYDQEKYQDAVKVWELNNQKYVDKVARNPHAMFLISSSYLKLGLGNLFSKYFNQLKSAQKSMIRTFPRWVKFRKEDHLASLISELEVMDLMNRQKYVNASKLLTKLKAENIVNFSKYFYLAKISFKLEKYSKAIEHFERLLNNEKERKKLNPLQFITSVQDYAESLYKEKQHRKIVTVLNALKKDLNALMAETAQAKLIKKTNLIERFDYLIIESTFANSVKDYSPTVKLINDFKKNYANSLFRHRLSYLMAKCYINMFEKDKGIELLNNLVNGADVPDYLKKGAKTELNLIKLKNEAI